VVAKTIATTSVAGWTGDRTVDGYFSAALLARICAFAEMLSPGAESTPITRGGDAPFDAFSCEVFTQKNHFTLTSCGGLVRLFVQPLDSHEDHPVLLVETEAVSEHSADTLRTGVAVAELLVAMRERHDHGGLRTLRRLIDDALPVDRRRHLWL
jgi:hypothetical protein